jgi:hypothetical protein
VKIDRRTLNLVLPITIDDNVKIFVHSAPISTDVYKMHWKVLSKTFADIHNDRLFMAGGRVAHECLKDTAVEMGIWEDNPRTKSIGIKKTLIAEIHRRTHVLVPTEKGWDMLPYDDAVAQGTIDAEIADEIEGALVFFTAGSSLYLREDRQTMLTKALFHWNAEITYSDCTEYRHSLTTSTTDGNSGAKAE